MRQRWYLYNIDKQEVAEGLSAILADFFFRATLPSTPGAHTALLSSIRRPSLPKEVDTWMASGRTIIQRYGFGKLPLEVFDMIMDQLQSMDLFVLALTCKSMLCALRTRLLSTLKELHAPWQNCRLILLGRNPSHRDDLPASLHLSADERAKIFDVVMERYRNHANRYTYAFGRADPFYYLLEHLPKGLRDVEKSGRGSRRPGPTSVTRDWRRLCVLWGCGAPICYPDGQPVLCNASKGEYIRADGLTAPDTTLAHALLVQIVWSADPLTSFPRLCAEEVARTIASGPWAGDRVSVETMETLPTLPTERREEGWDDVTSRVDSLLWKLWTAGHLQGHQRI
ncbi:hypothetical protein GY45DRAFT_1323101 [Cubamyces sp. BRFM 1775]|nr:hypothetical protein GY45DRAFT_1323101 [Cubamyces sp. BRFM 1775]